jgi:fatty acid desaturase
MGEQDRQDEGGQAERKAAIKRLEDKRSFQQNVVAYIVVNGMLIGIWAVTGAGFFWPIFVILAWGVGLALHAWNVYGMKPITEDEIRREMGRHKGDAV